MHSFTIHLFSSCYCLTTGNGDHVLFKELRSLLVKGLAREPVEWKRCVLHIDLLFRFSDWFVRLFTKTAIQLICGYKLYCKQKNAQYCPQNLLVILCSCLHSTLQLLECWQLTCQFPTWQSPAWSNSNCRNYESRYSDQQTWGLTENKLSFIRNPHVVISRPSHLQVM